MHKNAFIFIEKLQSAGSFAPRPRHPHWEILATPMKLSIFTQDFWGF